MKMSDCTHFDKCSAPVCPLDSNWRERTHRAEDRVCLFLSEAVKPGAVNRIPAELLDSAVRMASDPSLPGTIKRKLRVSAATASRIEVGRRLGRHILGMVIGKCQQEGIPIA
jgi:hypothetical protein